MRMRMVRIRVSVGVGSRVSVTSGARVGDTISDGKCDSEGKDEGKGAD